MRRYGVLTIIFILAIQTLVDAQDPNCQSVYFADPVLKAQVAAALEVEEPNSCDMLRLDRIYGPGITDLTGLEYALNLTKVRLGNNGAAISSLAPLAGLTKIEELVIEGSGLESLEGLEGLAELRIAILNENSLTSISALGGLANLTHLYVWDNSISDIGPLAGLTNLVELNLRNNRISDARPLSGLTSLRALHIERNRIIDIGPIAGLMNLKILGLGNNDISDISVLSGLTSLTGLDLSYNNISNIESLSGLTNLQGLSLSDNPVGHIGVLSELTNLTGLYLNSTGISDISPISGMLSLNELWLFYNNISDIAALAGLTNLTGLNLGANELNAEAYTLYIPLILANNPGIDLSYDEAVWRTLTVSSGLGGSVIGPGEGAFRFIHGQEVAIEAVLAETAYRFDRWTGTATTVDEAGRVADPLARRTAVMVDDDYTLEAVFVERAEGPALGITLGNISIDEPAEYYSRVLTNDTPEAPVVEYVTGIGPDPNGMIQMAVVEEEPARAKGTFGQSTAQRILVRFDYLFESTDDIEFVVYLSDVPELLNRDDPTWEEHYIQIGRIPAPPVGRPGSVGSGRFGTFQTWAWTEGLDLSNGTWVELELISGSTETGTRSLHTRGREHTMMTNGGSGSAYVDNWAVEVHCDGICMDLNWSDAVDEEDFLLVVAASGREAGLIDDGQNSLKCLDGIFTSDGYVNSNDVHPWSWALYDEARKNFCPELPLDEDAERYTKNAMSPSPGSLRFGRTLASVSDLPGELMVMGKRRMSGQYTFSDLLGDCLCLFEDDLTFVVDYAEAGVPRQGNIRAVVGPDELLYLVNSEAGLLQIDEIVTPIIPPSVTAVAGEPRYQGPATIQIGIQEDGAFSAGRPILDAAFDSVGDIYVMPVVVRPEGQPAYEAAARLRPRAGANPPYDVVQLYDDAPPANDNQYRDHLREIEVDTEGNVYLLNAHALNESCILWKYASDGTLTRRLDLLSPESPAKVADPLALHVSHDGQTLYLASGQYNRQSPNDSIVYKLATSDFSSLGTATIQNMRQIAGVTEDPATGTLWIAGVNMPEIPEFPNPAEPFYIPALAELPAEAEVAGAIEIADPVEHNLALPTSIMWIGQ